MKITKLELENFKLFESSVFNFKKITILAGANSAGKSTILNALACVLQGRESKPFPFYFNNYGDNVHLGGFKDIVRGGNTSSKFSIGVGFNCNGKDIFAKGAYRYAPNGQQILIQDLVIDSGGTKLELKWEGSRTGYSAYRTIDRKSSVVGKRISNAIISSLSEILIDETADTSTIRGHVGEMLQTSQQWEIVHNNKASKDIYSALNDDISYRFIIDRYKKPFSEFVESTSYIGPIRPYPSRHYFLSTSPERMDARGSNAFQLLIDWNKSNNKKFNNVVSGLKMLKLADDLNPESIKDELVELLVKPCGQSHNVNLSDVGFGLSQILPVLVANEVAEDGATLLINQPEVHLHPSSQALLANYFSEISKNKNFIIETHSEYLINRFRLLVAKGLVDADDVSIIYIDGNEGETRVSNIDIDSDGALLNAPESFFDTYYVDGRDLVFASMQGE